MPIYKDGKNKNAEGLQRYKVRVNYKTATGDHKQLTRVAYGLQQAKQLENLLQSEQKTPTTTKNFDGLYLDFLETKKHELRETSLDTLAKRFRNHILPFFSGYKLNKITPQVIESWKKSINDKSLSVNTRHSVYTALKAFLNWCERNKYLTDNPIIGVPNFRDAYATPKPDKIRYYTPSQFKQYIAYALQDAEQKKDFRFYVFFTIAYYTGMRKGEINALKWTDLDGNVLHVRRSIAQKLAGGDRETPPKNKSSYRSVQCPLPLLHTLETQKSLHQALTPDWQSLRICGGEKCLRDTTLDKKNRCIAVATNLPHIKIHDFRHSHASLLANNGINIQEIARRLGHSKIEQTWNTYSHLYPKEEERAVDVLNNL